MINGHANMVGFSHAAEFSLIISEIVALFNVIFYVYGQFGWERCFSQTRCHFTYF